MQELEDTQHFGPARWLFARRLQFLGSQEQLRARTQNFNVSQELFLNAKKNDPGPIREITCFKDLKDAYKVFNSLVVRFRFNAKNLEQTFTRSRNELKGKKHLKQIERQCKTKVKRIMEFLCIPDEEEQYWKTVLNHKNLIEHILKTHVFLKHLLDANFQLIKQGGAHPKNQKLPKELQIYVCVLAIDVLTLFNNLKSLIAPLIQEQNNPSNSKVELQEKLLFQSALEDSLKDQIESIKNLEIQRFLNTIKRLASQVENNNYPFKAWISIQQIRQSFLMDKFGVPLKKFHPTAAKELMLYWHQVYIEYFNKTVSLNRKKISLKQSFEEYKIIFRYYLTEATKKQTQTCHVLQYLDLIQKIWVNIDLTSASNLFWQELALVSRKITLPAQFDNNSREFVIDIVKNIVNNFKAKENQEFLSKIKATVLKLSMNLLALERDQDLTEHYFLKNQKQLRLLLTERDVLDRAIKDIYNKTNKQDEGILSIINNINQKMTVDVKKKEFLMQSKYQKEVIQNLYSVYEKEHRLIDEIKYFLLMARCLSNRTPSREQLQACLSHYYKQRNGVLTNQQRLSSEEVNRLPYGLLDCIKNFTFELVLNIKLNKPSGELDRLVKIIYKLLKVYQEKRKAYLRNTDQNNQQNEQQEELQVSSLLLRRSSSMDLDERWFQMEAEDVEDLEHDDQRYDDFTMNYLKKLFELRVEMIVKSVYELEEKQLPFREEFTNIKGRIYTYAASSQKDLVLREDVKKLPEIQFDFIKRRYFEAWSALRKLKDIEGVNKILQQAWDGKRNLLKLFVTIFLKYKEPIFQASLKGKDLQGKNVQHLIDESLKCEHRDLKIDSALKQDIINSIRILDSIEKVNQLKKELVEQDEQLSNLEEAKNYKSVREDLRFKQIEDKLQIFAFMKNDIITMRKFTIKLEPNEIEEVYRKLRKLTQYNRNITLETNKQKDMIIMKVDDIQNSFDSYPKLVKFLIQSYLEIIDFCKEQLNFQLYPLMLYNHFKIYKKNEHNIILKMNPYEGILLNAILPYKQLKSANIYKYPKYPFIEFADQLSKKFQRDKIYDHKNTNKAEQFAFQHLIEEMKALSMEIQGGNFVEVAKAILKCPYFWSSADKLFQIVEFKQRYQSIVNIEQSRRKENEKIRESLKGQQKQAFTYWPPEKKHPNYKLAYGYNKTNQVYFSIQGLLERQAFEEDIGNFRSNDVNQKYKFHGYHWSKGKTEIERLVKMVAEREKKKGSNTSFYDKTFSSFQNQIRNLRNLSVHYIYDSEQKKEIDLEDKLRIFETYFPKLFVFLYRWRPFLGKDYVNQIKPQKISLLKQLFCRQDNSQIIARLSSIKELQTYNIKNNNSKNYLLELFNYDFARVNSCQPCKILCNSLKKQPSFWGFLQDVKRQNYKEGKDMTYNLLFWDHDKKGCNGMVNVLFAYFNVTQRNQFTTEQFAHVKSSLIMMQIEKSRLEEKIQKKLQSIAEMKKSKTPIDEGDNSPASDSESLEIQKNREPVEKRFKKLTERELDNLYDQLVKLDYVCKYFIYQLEMEFPYLFYDLRKERYQWDEKAWQYPKKE